MFRDFARISALLAVGVIVAAMAIACGGDDGYSGDPGGDASDDGASSEVGAPSGQPTAGSQRTPLAGGAEAPAGTVSVTLQEYKIGTDPFHVSAGETTFRVNNAGPADEHEFVLIKTDLNPVKLPSNDDGSVNVDELDVIGEIEPFAVGDTQELTVDLAAGAYVLICNVVLDEAGVTESHYQNGMRESFRVD